MEIVIQEIGLMIKSKVEEYMFMHKLMKNMMENGTMDLDMVMELSLINVDYMKENFKII